MSRHARMAKHCQLVYVCGTCLKEFESKSICPECESGMIFLKSKIGNDPDQSNGVVYVIGMREDPGIFKIGRSTFNGVKERLGALQTGNPYELYVAALFDDKYGDLEDILHETFKKNLFRGEWFKFTKKRGLDEIALAALKVSFYKRNERKVRENE